MISGGSRVFDRSRDRSDVGAVRGRVLNAAAYRTIPSHMGAEYRVIMTVFYDVVLVTEGSA